MNTVSQSSSGMPLILAAKSRGLPDFCMQTGFYPCAQDEIIDHIEGAGLWLGPRPILEEDPTYRQTIPYVILQYQNKIVQYTRTSSGGEGRLHGRASIGLGGHIDLEDVIGDASKIDLRQTLGRAAARELDEELGIVEFADKCWMGLLVDNDSAVGRVHVGVVGLWTLCSAPSGQFEEAIGDVSLKSLDELHSEKNRMETWSAMLLPHLASTIAAMPVKSAAA